MSKPSAEGKLVFTMPRRSHQSDKFQFMSKPSAEGKLVFTMPRRSHQSDILQFIGTPFHSICG